MKMFSKALLCAVSLVAISTAAKAADAVIEEAPVAGYNWSGFYIGVGVGAGANVAELSTLILPGLSLDGIGGEGVFGELTVGYDYLVAPRFLVGALADVHYSNIETRLEIPLLGGLDATASDTYGFDVGLRAGYLFTPSTLGYVLGGYAWQKGEIEVSGLGGGGEIDSDRDGYFVGVGVETAIANNWTLKTEYRFTQFGDDNVLEDLGAPDGFLDSEVSSHTFRVGANYRFGMQNGGAAAFEAPAYNWTGFYVGGALGAGASVYELELGDLVIPGGLDFNGLGGEGVFGEINAGYDYDFGTWVAGVLVDASLSGNSFEIGGGGDSIELNADHGFDILARAGMKVNESTLAYAIGGYSWQHFELDLSDLGGDDVDWDSSGFSIGGGLETAVTEKVSVNLEYRYSQFDEDLSSLAFGDGAPDGLLETEPSFHTVRIGAKYKFN
jgi:outer membrane immunogenic protein